MDQGVIARRQVSMNVLVTGASGFIGAALVSRLDNKGHRVVPLRRAATAGNEAGPTWNPQAGQIHLEPAGQLDAVVHLAGENMAQRWTPTAKARIRVVHLRLGIVLARHSGALAKMLPAFRLGLGGRLGTGRQYWSWIALEDLLRVVERALQDDHLSGPVNAVSPTAVTNTEFTAALSRALRRPALLPVPALAVKLNFAEMGREALLASARVRPARLAECGFEFLFPKLDEAFNHLLTRPIQTS